MTPQLEIQLIAAVTAAACGLVGVFLVLRKTALLSDAISHAILPGIVLAFFWTENLNSPLLLLAAALTGVLTVGLIECVLLGWVFGAGNLRAFVNQHSKLKLGAWFDVLLRFIIPAILLTVIVWNLVIDLTGEQLYGAANPLGFVDWFPVVIPILWIVGTLSLATYLTRQPSAPDPTESPIATFEA